MSERMPAMQTLKKGTVCKNRHTALGDDKKRQEAAKGLKANGGENYPPPAMRDGLNKMQLRVRVCVKGGRGWGSLPHRSLR